MTSASAIVWLNGKFLPVAKACISILDRSFLYGDSLFESIPFRARTLLFWDEHLARLHEGCKILDLKCPYPTHALAAAANSLIERNRPVNGLVRLHLSRGVGLRGYSPRHASNPTACLSLHPFGDQSFEQPLPWKLASIPWRLPAEDPFCAAKHGNKLFQVMAKAHAQSAGADEPLILNTRNQIAETASANIFWIKKSRIHTPSTQTGILPGVTRSVLLGLCAKLGFRTSEVTAKLSQLRDADGIFLSLSSLGIVEVSHLDGVPVQKSGLVPQLRQAYEQRIQEEISRGLQPRSRRTA